MPKGDTPTFKQKLFAQKYVELKGKGTDAAMQVYDVKKRATAKSLAHQNLDKPIVQEEIKKILQSVGLTMTNAGEYLKTAISSGLGEKATNSDSLRGLDMLFKMHNAYPATKSLKLSYSRQEQTLSKDFTELTAELRKMNEATSTLLSEAT